MKSNEIMDCLISDSIYLNKGGLNEICTFLKKNLAFEQVLIKGISNYSKENTMVI